ncbi:MAG: type VI secretion system-associated FHA domain protein TagH [Rhizobiaceae bacterium]
MSLVLTLQQGPRAQAKREVQLDTGELVIGRSPDSDWQIDDPDMFVSRAHCRIAGAGGSYTVTDISSSGLFIDDAARPLGAGNSAPLRAGMRLRMGDYVVRVSLQSAEQPAPRPDAGSNLSRSPVDLGGDDFFARREPELQKQPRPSDLPKPFEQPNESVAQPFAKLRNVGQSEAFDDPFSLDPLSNPSPARKEERPRTFIEPAGFDPAPGPARAAPQASPPAAFDDFGFDRPRSAPPVSPPPSPPQRAPWELPAQEMPQSKPVEPAFQPDPVSPPRVPAASRPVAISDDDLRAAFMRGLGLSSAEIPARDAVAEMEKFGSEYRLMMDGIMQLLRKRAEEKSNARVAQTVVGASQVNPLKFLPTVDDALATILAERSPGFLGGRAAIADAIRDLAQHHVRAWRGIQSALRRMIDRFDPAALEKELKTEGMNSLLPGGRASKLWQLYQKRHREIAQSAENRFLGEIGADFRDAYEEE